ncbi:YbaN family protein [Paracoccus pacificus]|uniref:YbaN family protein n=1 Tax=Paracoccus pacificus TaxID=1463598 RepID=A0ABW4R3J4_9RHOB
MRWVYLGLGWIATALGFVGAFLPVVPTVPFLIVAVWCFDRSSPRLRAMILKSEILGPPLRKWLARGAISRRIKIITTLAMAVGIVVATVLALPPVVILLQVAVCSAVLAYIWTRPEA